MYRLGVDVGGTNTDAVILGQGTKVIASVKTPTTSDIQSGIEKAIKEVISISKVNAKEITHAMLGTTQCTNAIVERKGLAKVGVLRLSYPANESVAPYTSWPEDIIEVIGNNYKSVSGGYEYTGIPIAELDEGSVYKILEEWRGKVEAIAVIGIFSSVNDNQELRVRDIITEVYGEDFPVSCSSQIGSVGFIDRENSTILNAALNPVIQKVTGGFLNAQKSEGISNAKMYLCQNDGTLMTAEYASQFPIFTIAAGPTNSIRGASFLAEKTEAITLDVGGTTSDLGVLTNGFPRESSLAVNVGGIQTNFRMPDILSIGLGGGSIVKVEGDSITVGPESVGHLITQKAKVFGGDVLTATDIAVRLGHAKVGDPSLVEDVPMEVAQKAHLVIKKMVEEAIDQMKTDAGDVELVLVGGGDIIIPLELAGVSKVIKVENGSVANAIGASISQISGRYEQLYTYVDTPREESINDATEKAKSQAIEAGAVPETLELVEVEEIPLAYAEGNANRVIVKVVGDMN